MRVLFFCHNTNIFLFGSKNISQTWFHILGGWKSFQSLCFCGAAKLTSSREVHPEHLHPNCSCVNSLAHATGSCDTDIWYHYNEIMWITRFFFIMQGSFVTWPLAVQTDFTVRTLGKGCVESSLFNNYHFNHCYFIQFWFDPNFSRSNLIIPVSSTSLSFCVTHVELA